MKKPMKIRTVLLSLTLCFLDAGAQTQPNLSSPVPAYAQVLLEGAVFSAPNLKNSRDLLLDLEEVGGKWSAVYGVARDHNMAFHRGAVKSSEKKGDTWTLHVGMDVTPDKWVAGGPGDYQVVLRKKEDGSYEGQYRGTFNGTAVSGPALAQTYNPQRDANFAPLTPQEHPRLLFRAQDLPALREKAKTPFGIAALERMEKSGTPAALGMLYQLTGDPVWAQRAEAEAELYLAGKKPDNSPFVPMMANWSRLEQLALVYDLCYDRLSDDFKARYRAWISDFTFQVYFAPENMGGNINWHPVSNHSANVYSGFTLSALALFDEPSPPPATPDAPFLDDVLPPRDFVPAEGVPVVDLVPGVSPTEWIHTEALRRVTPDDPREVFYGLESIDAAPGSSIRVGDFPLTFAAMPEANRSTAPHGGLHVGHFLEASASAKLKEPLTLALYTVIRVNEPGEYVFTCPVSRSNLAQASLAGKRIADGQVLRLEKGLYPLMTLVQWRMKWGEIAPALRPATPENRSAWLAKAELLRAAHQTRMEGHAAVLDNWKRTSGGDPAFARMLRLSRFTNLLHCTGAVGRGGFQGESGHYSIDANYGHAQLWPVYRRVMGFDLTPDREYPDYLPRKIIGGPQDITGTSDIGDRFFPSLFATVSPEWQPEILSAWHREHKVKNPELPVEVLQPDPVRAFIAYPLDMKPAPIGTRLPTVWEAPGFGYYVLRSGWDDDAFIAQVHAKHQVLSGWSGKNAGTYRLHGLGRDWASGVTDRYRTREQENVVWFPETDLSEGARGHTTYFHADENRMVVSINLDEVYETQGRYWFTRYGNRRKPSVPTPNKEGVLPERPEASGIRGMRSLAFDFSGDAGVPCLFVVVDRIEGGEDEQRRWLFQTDTGGARDVSPFVAEVLAGSGFRLKDQKGPATLRGTFAHPPEATVNSEPMVWEYIKNVGTGRGQTVRKTIRCLSLPGTDHFFFVGTVSPDGKDPEIMIEGKGLDAVIRVGKRRIHFDGEKIVLGKIEE
jgi:hypothetical protein